MSHEREPSTPAERESARLLVWIDNICADCGRQKAKDETPCEVLCRRCYEECLR